MRPGPARRSARTLLAAALVVGIVAVPSGLLASPTHGPAAPRLAHAPGTPEGFEPARGLRPIPSLPPVGPSPYDQWINRTPSGQPPARDQAAMTFDPAANATLLFGGRNATTGRALNDTWLLHQGVWTNITPALPRAPSPRWGAAIAYDALDNETVLFGGRNLTAFLGDTWTLTIAGWAPLSPAHAPSPRVAEMTDDFRSGDVVLFGGVVQTLTPSPGPVRGLNDTWFFRGGGWINETNPTGPGPTTSGNAVYDALDRYVFLLAPGPSAGHSWALIKGKWRGILSANIPGPAVLNGSAVWDAQGQFVLAFGSQESAPAGNQTWMYRAGVWTNLTGNLSVAPPPRSNGSIDDDPGAGAVLVFGGDPAGQPAEDRNDLWAFYGVPFQVTLNSTPVTTDVEHAVLLQVLFAETGGAGFVYGYGYTGLPLGCSTANLSSLACDPLVAGTYDLVVTVNRSDGTAILASRSLTVNPLPSVQLVAPITVTDPREALNFSAIISNGTTPYQVLWNFGDNATAAVASTAHAYARPGSYPVNVSVTDAVGSIAEYGVRVTINLNLTLSTGANRTATEVGWPVAFHLTAGGGTLPYQLSWAFGDGSTDVGSNPTPSHTYVTPGNYTVTATVTDAAGALRMTEIPILVSGRPQLEATANRSVTDVGVPVGFGVDLKGGFGPFEYAWSFSDGSSANGSSTSMAFTSAGPVTATVTVTDGNGVRTSNATSVLVVPTPTARLAIGTISGCGGPSTVTFLGQGEAGVPPYAYSWSFGDGTPSASGANATHAFSGVGPYRITLNVTDHLGGTASQNLTYQGVTCTRPANTLGGLSAVPDWGWALLGLVLVALVLGLYASRRRKAPPAASEEAIPAVPAAAPAPAAPPAWSEDDPTRPPGPG